MKQGVSAHLVPVRKGTLGFFLFRMAFSPPSSTSFKKPPSLLDHYTAYKRPFPFASSVPFPIHRNDVPSLFFFFVVFERACHVIFFFAAVTIQMISLLWAFCCPMNGLFFSPFLSLESFSFVILTPLFPARRIVKINQLIPYVPAPLTVRICPHPLFRRAFPPHEIGKESPQEKEDSLLSPYLPPSVEVVSPFPLHTASPAGSFFFPSGCKSVENWHGIENSFFPSRSRQYAPSFLFFLDQIWLLCDRLSPRLPGCQWEWGWSLPLYDPCGNWPPFLGQLSRIFLAEVSFPFHLL